MKFYYDGKLVRTSKNHVYTHAVINMKNGALVGCRANEQNAYSIISSELSGYQQGIENGKQAIKALESGKTYYVCKSGRRSFPIKFRKDDTVESWTKWISQMENGMAFIRENWKVVELEARA